MAVNMDALVRIKADVQGGNAIQAFSRDLKGLDGAAKISGAELGRMNIAINRMAREAGNTTVGIKQHIAALETLKSRVEIGGTAYNRLSGEIGKLQGRLKNLDGDVQKAGISFSALQAGLATLGIGAFVKSTFDAASQIERTKNQLKTLVGSASEAESVFTRLQEINKQSPFELKDLTGAATKLSAFGVSAKDLVSTTERLGKIAAGTNQSIDGIALAYGQVLAKGRLQGEELMQFQERGINLGGELQRMLGLNKEEFAKLTEQGKISSQLVVEAIKNMTGETGRFRDAFANTAGTLDAKLSNLKDAFFNAAGALGKAFEPIFKWILDQTTNILNGLTSAINQWQNVRQLTPERVSQLRNQAGTDANNKFGMFNLSGNKSNFFNKQLDTYIKNETASRTKASTPAVSVATAAPTPGTFNSSQVQTYRQMLGGGGGSAAGGGGTAGGGSGGATKREDSIGAQIAKALKSALDLTDAQAAGIVGNFIRESGLNPRVNEGGAVGLPKRVGGYGLAQWTGSRQDDLIGFAGGASKAGDLQTQLRFTIKELLGPERGALQKLKATQTPEDAAVSFDKFYERSGVKALGERKANARNVFSEIAGSGPAAGIDDYASMLQEQADSLQTSMKSGDELIKRLERQVDLTLLKTDADKDLQKILWDYQDRQAEINELLDQQQKTKLSELNTEVLKSEQLRIQTEELQKQNNSFFKEAGLNTETFASSGTSLFSSGSDPSAFLPSADLLNQQQTALDGILQKYPQIGEAATAASQLVTQSVQGMITGTQSVKEAFSTFLKSIGDMLIQTAQKMIAQYIAIGAAKLFAGLGGAASGGLGAAGSSAGAAAFGGSAGTGALGFQIPALFAKGGIMTGSGPMPLKRYAKGGIANSPQLAMFGEGRMPEAFVPLPDGRRIPVAMQGGGNGLREAMGSGSASAGSTVLNMSFQSTNIGGTEYVDRAQLEQAMAETRRSASRDGARRGMSMTLDKLQQSPATRSRVGMR